MSDPKTDPREIDHSRETVDIQRYPAAGELLNKVHDLLEKIQVKTPGKALEKWLNENYGPGNPDYEEMCRLVREGLEEGWVASGEVTGPKYRRSKVALPDANNLYMSVTTVYFDYQEPFAGQHHSHPYGEINCVVPIDPTFQLEGLPVDVSWQGAGWTSLAPGTHHYPRSRGGKGVVLFFLPSGRIGYDADPNDPQPTII